MKPIRDPLKLAKRLAAVAPAILAESFRPDCCIAATRVAIGVFARFGFEAAPVPTSVVIWNPAYTARVKAGKPARDTDELIRFSEIDGSWTVGIGFGPPTEETGRPGWDGHLIAAVRDYGTLRPFVVDLSLTQADRPARNIVLTPTFFTPPEKFWTVDDYTFIDINGCIVGYRLKPNSGQFIASPDWSDRDRTEPVIDAIVRELR